jgi:hypothetical protein
MKRSFLGACILLLSFLTIPSLSQGFEKPAVGQGEENLGQINPSWLALGVRSNYFQLTQSKRTIVGNLIAEDEDQNYWPINPLIQVNLSKHVALELGYNSFKAIMLNNDYLRSSSDGTLEWNSLMLGLQFRLPEFHKSFVPYFVAGVSYNKSKFQAADWYYYGFPDPATYTSWTSQGNKPEDFPNNGYRRIHSVEDSYGVFLGLGVDYFLTKNWAVNLDWRYHWSQINWTYRLINNDGALRAPEQGTAVLDSWILGLGIKYFF